MAKHGWNVVVCNHWGLRGVPLTSECFYTAGKSDDLGEVVNHLHRKLPETPLYAIGTILGANILVKYLGGDGVNVPLVGAAAISNPWDLLRKEVFCFTCSCIWGSTGAGDGFQHGAQQLKLCF